MDGKTLVGKILASSDQFAKFSNVFHCQRFALYSTKYIKEQQVAFNTTGGHITCHHNSEICIATYNFYKELHIIFTVC